jgi:hypothetical protein
MERRFAIAQQYGSQLWTREKGKQIRMRLAGLLENLEVGDVAVIDLEGVEVFDFSFADEFFGKTLLRFGAEYPGRFLVVENLSAAARENLVHALESSNVAVIERELGKASLLGKIHPIDQETFAEVLRSEGVSAFGLSKKLNVNPTAMNERLAKLTNLGVVRREKGSSASGREQFMYRSMS